MLQKYSWNPTLNDYFDDKYTYLQMLISASIGAGEMQTSHLLILIPLFL